MSPRSERQELLLVVEDDPSLRLGLQKTLRSAGYRVRCAATGPEGLAAAMAERPDLVLLDVMLPGKNGFEVCEELRAHDADLPILMVTAKGEEQDRVRGLRLGADDYVVKPFGVQELLARVDAALRRRRLVDAELGQLTLGELVVDFRAHTVTRNGASLPVTALEMKLLRYLVRHEGVLLPRQRILDAVWGADYFGTDRTVDNFVTRLRAKVEIDPRAPQHIHTVRGAGYRFSRRAETGLHTTVTLPHNFRDVRCASWGHDAHDERRNHQGESPMSLATRLPILALHLALSACGVHGSGAVATDNQTPAPAGTTVRIEQAERALDTGRDVVAVRHRLGELLVDPSLASADRDRALLAESRAAELSGDQEGAIRLVEELLGAHADDGTWAQAGTAEKALRRLLTGKEASVGSLRSRDRRPVAPIASAFVPFFPPGPAGDVEIRVVHYGSGGDATRLGTYNVGGAITDARRAACPLCEDLGHTRTLESGESSWTAIPKTVVLSRKALEIFYFDLGDGRVPARYDARLPLPSADVVARLERGEGVIAVKLRDGAPPVVLLAAPRWTQLAEVEEAFSKMTALPAEPQSVRVTMALKPEEIQADVRAAFGGFRACYEDLLARTPGAAGTSNVSFAIQPDGRVAEIAIDPGSTLRDPGFDACMSAGFAALVFPRAGARTTVKYPVSFSP